jgi:hypothetical protein
MEASADHVSRHRAVGKKNKRKYMALNKRHQACTVLPTIHLPAIQQDAVGFLTLHRAPRIRHLASA